MDRHFDVPANPVYSPDNVRIRSFDVEPYLDGHMLKWILEITESNAIPNTEIIIVDNEGHEVACSNIIGLVNNIVMLTVHIREPTQVRC